MSTHARFLQLCPAGGAYRPAFWPISRTPELISAYRAWTDSHQTVAASRARHLAVDQPISAPANNLSAPVARAIPVPAHIANETIPRLRATLFSAASTCDLRKMVVARLAVAITRGVPGRIYPPSQFPAAAVAAKSSLAQSLSPSRSTGKGIAFGPVISSVSPADLPPPSSLFLSFSLCTVAVAAFRTGGLADEGESPSLST